MNSDLNPQLAEELVKANLEIERLSNLLFGARCIYCEELLFADRKNQEIADAELRAHIQVCPKHPLPKVTAERDRLAAELNATKTECDDLKRQLFTYKLKEDFS